MELHGSRGFSRCRWRVLFVDFSIWTILDVQSASSFAVRIYFGACWWRCSVQAARALSASWTKRRRRRRRRGGGGAREPMAAAAGDVTRCSEAGRRRRHAHSRRAQPTPNAPPAAVVAAVARCRSARSPLVLTRIARPRAGASGTTGSRRRRQSAPGGCPCAGATPPRPTLTRRPRASALGTFRRVVTSATWSTSCSGCRRGGGCAEVPYPTARCRSRLRRPRRHDQDALSEDPPLEPRLRRPPPPRRRPSTLPASTSCWPSDSPPQSGTSPAATPTCKSYDAPLHNLSLSLSLCSIRVSSLHPKLTYINSFVFQVL